MKTLIKLIIVAAIVNGAARVGWASWRHYQFQDAVEEEMIFAEINTRPEVLHARIMELAATHEVPLDAEALHVTKQSFRTQVAGPYSVKISLIPGFYEPMWTFQTTVDVRAIR